MDTPLTDTKNALYLINDLFLIQINEGTSYEKIEIISKSDILDFDSFHEYFTTNRFYNKIAELLISKIKNKARENIDIYDRLVPEVASINKKKSTLSKKINNKYEVVDNDIRSGLNDQDSVKLSSEVGYSKFTYTNDGFLSFSTTVLNLLQNLNLNSTKSKSTKREVPKNLTLKDFFINPGDYDPIMAILVENNYVEEVTYIWKDVRRGKKTLAGDFVKHLFYKNYLKRLPSNKEVIAVCSNLFRLDIKIDCIKKTNGIIPDQILKIPRAPTV